MHEHIALITGASRGLGASIARRLAAEGLPVALCARHKADLAQVADQIRSAGGTAYTCPMDLADPASIDAAAAQVQAAFGGIDILINNAGLSWYKPFAEWTAEEVAQTLAVNLTGLIQLTHAVVPSMLQRQRGQIVNIASDIGRRVVPNMAAYVAAKHGVVGFSGSLLREVKDDGIRVMCVLPGLIDTYFHGGTPSGGDAGALSPTHVADTVWHLLQQPRHVVLDEVTIHPLGQEF